MHRDDVVVAEAEVPLGFAADGDELVLPAETRVVPDLGFGGTNDRRVVATTQTAVGRDDDLRDTADLQPLDEHRVAGAAAGGLQVADHVGDAVRVRNRRLHPLPAL